MLESIQSRCVFLVFCRVSLLEDADRLSPQRVNISSVPVVNVRDKFNFEHKPQNSGFWCHMMKTTILNWLKYHIICMTCFAFCALQLSSCTIMTKITTLTVRDQLLLVCWVISLLSQGHQWQLPKITCLPQAMMQYVKCPSKLCWFSNPYRIFDDKIIDNVRVF